MTNCELKETGTVLMQVNCLRCDISDHSHVYNIITIGYDLLWG